MTHLTSIRDSGSLISLSLRIRRHAYDILTSKLVNKVAVSKKYHVYAVLQEQARQDESGEKDPVAISRVSQQYSKGAVSRARAIGLLQLKERAE